MTAVPRPIIGISADVSEPRPNALRMECALAYCRAVAEAGGDPVVLPPIIEQIPRQLQWCRGFVLTGGDDPRMESFGEPTHPAAKPMHRVRQEYEVALLRALAAPANAAVPVLGVCLGMQLMALCASGRLNQHMPDDVPTSAQHAGNARHRLRIAKSGGPADSLLALAAGAEVVSHHRQAVTDPGRLRVVATAEDGIIEAIDDPARPFYLGVQWHPERTPDAAAGSAIFLALVSAARGGIAPGQ